MRAVRKTFKLCWREAYLVPDALAFSLCQRWRAHMPRPAIGSLQIAKEQVVDSGIAMRNQTPIGVGPWLSVRCARPACTIYASCACNSSPTGVSLPLPMYVRSAPKITAACVPFRIMYNSLETLGISRGTVLDSFELDNTSSGSNRGIRALYELLLIP